MGTVYQYILFAKQQNTWKGACAICSKFETLDRYFQIYQFVLKNYPKRERGYRIKVYRDYRFVERFGNWIDDNYIHNAISAMEKEVDF